MPNYLNFTRNGTAELFFSDICHQKPFLDEKLGIIILLISGRDLTEVDFRIGVEVDAFFVVG